MKLYDAMSLVAMAAHACDGLNFSFQSNLNGWYSCPSVPLCYPGFCKVPDCVNPSVDMFVKRIPAAKDPTTASNFWLLSDDAGSSSTSLEKYMYIAGLRRSTTLQRKYGSLSAFSTTSAAKDVATFFLDYTNGAYTIVYGWNYGSALAERLMHLNCPQVTGYVLDDIATTSGATRNKSYYVSMADIDSGDIGDAFMALCATTRECRKHFWSRSLANTLQDLMTQLDDEPKSACAALITKAAGDKITDPASHVLTYIFTLFDVASSSTTHDDDRFGSNILYLVQFSEYWEKPTPFMAEMTLRFTSATVSGGDMASLVPLYCACSKEKSAVCDHLRVGSYSANGTIYEVDEYCNKSAKIPTQASVLFMSTKLNPIAHYKYAEHLMKTLDGNKKELVAFEYVSTGTISGLELRVEEKHLCGMKLLLSYVTNDDDLELLDKSCVDETPQFNMDMTLASWYTYMKTDDAYDGDYYEDIVDICYANLAVCLDNEAILAGKEPTA
ncbi:unnamed protein product [Peronospora belbahrii]|uniref:AB hydrolase-1 domain-containing protein n=1 Tax=Peronospora belbahrii TaxID=622444 RepID=A0ABN8CMR5_9STRA|nr:unnamed protein product [Peronospora belbahrii]